MNPKRPRNLAASVRQRLLNRSRELGEDFQLILTHFAVERLLYRLGRSAHHGRFILKGAVLFSIWSEAPHRATRDLDLLGLGDNSISFLEEVFREIKGEGCRIYPKPFFGQHRRVPGLFLTFTAGDKIPITHLFGKALAPKGGGTQKMSILPRKALAPKGGGTQKMSILPRKAQAPKEGKGCQANPCAY